MMAAVNRFTDPTHLLREQYRDSSNLNARYNLHERFSTNPYAWHRWLFDQLALAPGQAVLEVGCGNDLLWLKNYDRLPALPGLVLSDLSPGMLTAARETLRAMTLLPRFVVADAQALPFSAEAFDVVIANHMLYHVPNRERAIAELRRVLRPSGRLYAATNGRKHMRELLGALTERIDDVHGFGLENGVKQLATCFSNVEVRRHDNALAITEVEPVLAYVRSDLPTSALRLEEVERLRASVAHAIAADGVFHVTKDAGLLIATP